MSESVSESVSDKGTYRAVWGQLKIKKGDQTKLACKADLPIAICSFIAPDGKSYGLKTSAKVYPVDLLMKNLTVLRSLKMFYKFSICDKF